MMHTIKSKFPNKSLLSQFDWNILTKQNHCRCPYLFFSCNQCYKFETHTDIEKATTSDLKAASDQGTILLIYYNNNWYGNGTVGDVNGTTATRPSNTYASSGGGYRGGTGYYKGWAADMEAKTAKYDSKYGMSYSLAGGAALLLGGMGLVKMFRRRRIALVSEEGSTVPSPLV